MADNDNAIEGAVAAAKRTVWIYVNRQVYPVHLPDPTDPGSSVRFVPVPDKKTTLVPGMYQTHPFFGHFVRLQRSISKEPAPDYLALTTEQVQGGPTVHDLLNMNPDALKGFLAMLAEKDPEMAAEIASSLPGVRRDRVNPAKPVPNPLQPTTPPGPVSQAPPGA